MTALAWLALWCVNSVVIALLLGVAIGGADLHDESDWSER